MLPTIDRVADLWQQSPTLKLLRARYAPLILFFLHRQFKETNSLTVPNTQLTGQLANLLEDIRFQDEDEKKQLDYVSLARKYIDEWTTDNYLQNFVDDATKQVVNALTKHSERAFQVLSLLQEREFVGTESKFQTSSTNCATFWTIVRKTRSNVSMNYGDRKKKSTPKYDAFSATVT